MTTSVSRQVDAQVTIGFANLAHSEWTKLRSVRSTYWAALGAFIAAIGVAVIICARMASLINDGTESADSFDPTTFSLNGLYLAQVAIGALGVLVISSEYGTGMIRATLVAVPQRLAVLASKGVVFGVATFVLGEVMSFAAFGLGQALLSKAHAGVTLTDPTVLRAVIGGGLYLAVIGELGFALGALIRHTAGALSAFFGILFATSVLIDILPASWHNAINYMPANAGSQIFAVQQTATALSPWAGIGLLSLYTAVALGLSAILMIRRDT